MTSDKEARLSPFIFNMPMAAMVKGMTSRRVITGLLFSRLAIVGFSAFASDSAGDINSISFSLARAASY